MMKRFFYIYLWCIFILYLKQRKMKTRLYIESERITLIMVTNGNNPKSKEIVFNLNSKYYSLDETKNKIINRYPKAELIYI